MKPDKTLREMRQEGRERLANLPANLKELAKETGPFNRWAGALTDDEIDKTLKVVKDWKSKIAARGKTK